MEKNLHFAEESFENVEEINNHGIPTLVYKFKLPSGYDDNLKFPYQVSVDEQQAQKGQLQILSEGFASPEPTDNLVELNSDLIAKDSNLEKVIPLMSRQLDLAKVNIASIQRRGRTYSVVFLDLENREQHTLTAEYDSLKE